jgi:starch synthase
MKAVILTREYPPDVYGGAGVHVDYLSRELARLLEVEVRCFGAPRPSADSFAVRAYEPWERVSGVLATMSVDLAMAAGLDGAGLVHSHTWYANLAGHLAKLQYGIPHVVTTHSLEPLRPWKAEQLGPGGYALSRFCERTALEGADAVVAVSLAMRDDVLRCYPAIDPERVHVILNGIDPEEYRPDPGTDVLARYGVDPARPYAIFVGRITRQNELDRDVQLVLCAGAPDTPEIAREVEGAVEELRARRAGVVWIEKMLEKREVVQLLTHATVSCVPSIYEPLGIVNLESMACATPVVATATGGIPEVVEDGITGLLVPFAAADATGTPRDHAAFEAALAARLNELVADPERARRMGEAGRRRVLERFTWRAIAERTAELYQRVAAA